MRIVECRGITSPMQRDNGICHLLWQYPPTPFISLRVSCKCVEQHTRTAAITRASAKKSHGFPHVGSAPTIISKPGE